MLYVHIDITRTKKTMKNLFLILFALVTLTASAQKNILSIKCSNDQMPGLVLDETVVKLVTGATTLFDSYDRIKTFSTTSQQGQISSGNDTLYSTNNLPDSTKRLEVPITLSAPYNANYTFIFSAIASFADHYNITFVDNLTNTSTRISNYKTSYPKTFNVAVNGAGGVIKGRFVLIITSSQIREEEPIEDTIIENPMAVTSTSTWESMQKGTLSLYNLNGEVVFESKDTDIQTVSLTTVPQGVYIAKAVAGNKVAIKKIFLNN